MYRQNKRFVSLILVLSFIMSFGTSVFAQGYEGKEGAPVKEDQGNEVVLYVTRHGKTMLNTTDRVQGWVDSPLTEAGVEVAEYLGRGLAGIPFTAVYSSDSGRAVETAEIVLERSNQNNLDIKTTKNLREWNFGKYEGGPNNKMATDIAKKLGVPVEDVFKPGIEKVANAIASLDETGEAENWEEIKTRIKTEMDNITKTVSENGGGNVLVTAHGLTINGILAVINPDHIIDYFENASITKIIYKDGKYTVESINDMSYVERGKTLAEKALKDNTVTLYVTRHGKTILNTTDRVQGWVDSPLTEAGVEVAEYLGRGLKDIPFVAVYSSDSGRAVETAEIALRESNQNNLKIIKTKNLRENNFGKYEGELNSVMVADIAEKYGMDRNTPQGEVFNRKFPELINTIASLDETGEAENWEDIETRLKTEMDNITKTVSANGGGNVLITAHGLIINGILSIINPDNMTGYLKNASITKITYKDGKYTIESINDMSYVENGKAKK